MRDENQKVCRSDVVLSIGEASARTVSLACGFGGGYVVDSQALMAASLHHMVPLFILISLVSQNWFQGVRWTLQIIFCVSAGFGGFMVVSSTAHDLFHAEMPELKRLLSYTTASAVAAVLAELLEWCRKRGTLRFTSGLTLIAFALPAAAYFLTAGGASGGIDAWLGLAGIGLLILSGAFNLAYLVRSQRL